MRKRLSETKANDKRGSALLVSMMFVILVAGMGVCMVQLHTSQTRRQEQAIDNKRSIYVAEAGLAESYLAISMGMSGNIGTAEEPATFGDGIVWVEATRVNDERVALMSTGLVGKGRFSIAIVLQRQMDPVASLGFYSGSDITIGAGVLVDGFDSTIGTYAEQVDPALQGDTTGLGAKLGAGGDIVLEGSVDVSRSSGTVIYGDAHPGPTGTLSLGTGVTVTGETSPLEATRTLPDVEIPEVARYKGDFLLESTGLTLENGKYGFGKLELASRARCTIRGPALIVVDQLIIGAGSEIKVDTSDGSVTIFVNQHLNVPEGALMSNVGEDPNSFAVLIAATEWADFDGDGIADPPVKFQQQGEFYGYIYGPGIDLEISSGTHLIGGAAANSISVAPGGRLSFDSALESASLAIAGLPRLIAWRICEIPERAITRNNTTPTKYLDAMAVTPELTCDARLDKYMTIRYYDLAGINQTYSGAESAFDWSDVDEVTGIIWDDDPVIGDEGQIELVPSTMTTSK